VVEKVRQATMAELARVGFPGLTIEGVAKAANVNRTTIYRRWPSKGALLLAVRAWARCLGAASMIAQRSLEGAAR
jgi:AcrR family transcriptional regulator